MRRRRSRSLALSATFVALVAVTAAGCGGDDETLYCGDEWGVVLPEERCEGEGEGSSGAYIYRGSYPGNIHPGDRLPGGGTRISAWDGAARSGAGLPARGGFGGNGRGAAGG